MEGWGISSCSLDQMAGRYPTVVTMSKVFQIWAQNLRFGHTCTHTAKLRIPVRKDTKDREIDKINGREVKECFGTELYKQQEYI